MRTRDADILIIPGLGGSGPEHWQTRWEAKLPTARRVEQEDWDRPVKQAWSARIADAVAESTRPVVIVAHSLGVIAAADALAACDPARLAGAFLVAPPDAPRLAEIPAVDPAFVPYPSVLLPCPGVLVGSTNDPYGPIEAAEGLAKMWGLRFVDAGAAGHINAASGHGPWPEGLMSFAGFLSKLAAPT